MIDVNTSVTRLWNDSVGQSHTQQLEAAVDQWNKKEAALQQAVEQANRVLSHRHHYVSRSGEIASLKVD